MLKIDEIKELIRLIDGTSISDFSYEQEGTKINIKKYSGEVVAAPQVSYVKTEVAPQAVTAAIAIQPEAVETKQTNENLHSITSPMVGTFYQSSSPDSDAYVSVGSKVSKNSIVCIVEAMKLFNEIEAEVSGEIVEILVKNGELVEYGQPLFLVKPE